MNTQTIAPAPTSWVHADLTPCTHVDTCHQGPHFWPGGAPGPVVE